ncbi:hypothetical protein LJR234_006181 [Mesorhizobium amorphae]
MDDVVDRAVGCYVGQGTFDGFFIRYIAAPNGSGRIDIEAENRSASLVECIGDRLTNSAGSACDNGASSNKQLWNLKGGGGPLLRWVVEWHVMAPANKVILARTKAISLVAAPPMVPTVTIRRITAQVSVSNGDRRHHCWRLRG